MVDLHCHILPGVDDGSQNIEQSIQMAREAYNSGFTTLCCTSHYYDPQYIVPQEKLLQLLSNLQKELNDNNIDIELKIGTELFINDSVDELIKQKYISTLNNTKYLLIELPLNYPISTVEKFIFRVQNMGLIPILAHPERYSYVQDDPSYVLQLIDRGVYLQGNYASLIGKYGSSARSTIKTLLKSNMIHFLASDTHRDNSIYTCFDSIFKELNKIISPEEVELLTQINPQKVINDEYIEIPEPNLNKKKRFLFW